MISGKFITFEGGEGVGKTTQIQLLYKKLIDKGIKTKTTREPGGDEVGEKIRAVIKSSTVKKMDPLCETLLLFAARRDHYIKIIKPLLQQGYTVICDRFYDSTLVYQGLLKNVSIEDIMKLKQMTIGDTEPDFTIVLDVDSEISLKRLNTRNLIQDEYDTMKKEQHDIIRKGFQNIAKIFSFRSALISATGNERTVFSKVIKAIETKFDYSL
ncbi:MAG: dTMP kinase [Alphaproteobacteria bacterium]|nr:dTMP kinase [Alphaproteobacteria bacterium]